MEIKAIIVEDEIPAQETLELYLQKYCPEVKVIAKASDANKALEVIKKNKADLVFLDVELPFGNAFDLLEKIGSINFETIFITAYEDYAMKALNSDAVHYILKPIEIEELIKAVEKVKKLISVKQDKQNEIIGVRDYETLQAKKFIFPNVNGFDLLSINTVIKCEADNNYTVFYFDDKSKKIISKTLKRIEEQLKDYGFLRVHKKYLVNLNKISSYQRGKTGSLIMTDNTEVPVSSGKKSILMEMLE